MISYPVLPFYAETLQRRSLRIVGYGAIEPITLELAQEHLRLDTYGSPLGHPEDRLLTSVYIPAAREYCEMISGRAFAYQTYEYISNSFPSGQEAFGFYEYGQINGELRFPIGPVRGVSYIQYLDSDSVLQTVDPLNYNFDLYAEPAYIGLSPTGIWPAAAQVPNAVRIGFLAGYDVEGSSPTEYPLPAMYKNAILLMLAHFYENRSQTEQLAPVPHELKLGVMQLLKPDSLRNGFA